MPKRLQAENATCYIGQDDTSIPVHRDLCGTMGHNIMAMVTLGAYAEWIFVLNEERNMLDYCLKETADDNTINNLQKLNTNNSLTKSSSMESDRA